MLGFSVRYGTNAMGWWVVTPCTIDTLAAFDICADFAAEERE